MKQISLIMLLFCAVAVNAQFEFGPFNEVNEGGSGCQQLILVDFDNDGDIDILIRKSSTVNWFENLGLGFFSELQTITYTYETIDAEATDFDGDGNMDVLVSLDYSEGVIFCENLDDEIFDYDFVHLDLVSGWGPIVVTDLDSDGDEDLICAYGSYIKLFENDGSGSILSSSSLFGLAYEQFTDIKMLDADNDGDDDLVWTTKTDEGGVYYSENIGGDFTDQDTLSNTGNSYSNVYTSDLNGDSFLDLVVGSGIGGGGGTSTVIVIMNAGDGTFLEPILVSDDFTGEMIVHAADLDLDGDKDILLGKNGGTSLLYFENLDGDSFAPPAIVSDELVYVNQIGTTDIDGDGDLDIFVSSYYEHGVGWFENLLLDPRQVEGQLFIDVNLNGIMDVDEVGLAAAIIHCSPDETISVTHTDGTYTTSFDGLDDGTYEIYPELDYWAVTSPDLTHEVLVEDPFDSWDTLDFGLMPDEFVDSILTDVEGAYFQNCNDTVLYWIGIQNLGSTLPSGILHLELNDSLYYVNAEIAPDSVVDQNVYWSYEDLFYFDSEVFYVEIGTPDGYDDTVTSILTATVIDGGDVVFTATDEQFAIITCAYDPNDKTAKPKGEGETGNIPMDTDWIEYTIRFQNTGTDTAHLVIIRDQLDDDFLWTSFDPLFSSHEMVINYNPSGEVSFVFENIMLPDSNVNEAASQGYLKYRIKVKPDLPVGTIFENTAGIYFDYNPVVITNTAINTLYEPVDDAGIYDLESENQVIVYPNPTKGTTTILFDRDKIESNNISLVVFDLLGNEVYRKDNLLSNQELIESGSFHSGVYLLVLIDNEQGNSLHSTKLVVE